MLTEKGEKNAYKLDSLCKYDAVVCKHAGKKGMEEFGVIQHDEMFTYFTYDNTVKAVSTQASEGKVLLVVYHLVILLHHGRVWGK